MAQTLIFHADFTSHAGIEINILCAFLSILPQPVANLPIHSIAASCKDNLQYDKPARPFLHGIGDLHQ